MWVTAPVGWRQIRRGCRVVQGGSSQLRWPSSPPWWSWVLGTTACGFGGASWMNVTRTLHPYAPPPSTLDLTDDPDFFAELKLKETRYMLTVFTFDLSWPRRIHLPSGSTDWSTLRSSGLLCLAPISFHCGQVVRPPGITLLSWSVYNIWMTGGRTAGR